MYYIDKGKIIGEFDFYDYGFPTKKAYLYHMISNGGNDGDMYPHNREYLRILGFDKDNNIVEYGYVYFMLYTSKEGLKISKYIGSKVIEKYRNKGLGDLLMSLYLYYSYDNGFDLFESTTRQRKLDLLSLMNKYGFRLKNPEKYDNGKKTILFNNNMVVDIYKQEKGVFYYRFKTSKAENLYRRSNIKLSSNYNYLISSEENPNDDGIEDYIKLGWVVPNEDYERVIKDDDMIKNNLDKSGFSK